MKTISYEQLMQRARKTIKAHDLEDVQGGELHMNLRRLPGSPPPPPQEQTLGPTEIIHLAIEALEAGRRSLNAQYIAEAVVMLDEWLRWVCAMQAREEKEENRPCQ